MISFLKTIHQKWVVLSKRDRMMLFLVGMFGVLGLMDTYMTNPIRQQKRMTEDETAKVQQDIAKVQLQIAQLGTATNGDNNPLQKEIGRLKTELVTQEKLLFNVESMMVTPLQMTEVMKKLLKRHEDVQVIAMESLPPVNFVRKHVAEAQSISVEGEQNAIEMGILYQHAIRLQLKGGYLALLNYVADLKALGGSIAWESAELKAKYPQTELVLEVYTLSPQKAWLGI